MAIDTQNGRQKYDDILRHVGHAIECVRYGLREGLDEPDNVAIECVDCCEILVDADHVSIS